MVRLTLMPDHKTIQVSADDGQVEYDTLSGKVARVGAVKVEYDWLSGNISKVGDVKIEYDGLSGFVTRVGNAHIEYDGMSGRVAQVTGTTGDDRVGFSA